MALALEARPQFVAEWRPFLERACVHSDERVRRVAERVLDPPPPEGETPAVRPTRSADIETLLREIDDPNYAVQNAAWIALWDAPT